MLLLLAAARTPTATATGHQPCDGWREDGVVHHKRAPVHVVLVCPMCVSAGAATAAESACPAWGARGRAEASER